MADFKAQKEKGSGLVSMECFRVDTNFLEELDGKDLYLLLLLLCY